MMSPLSIEGSVQKDVHKGTIIATTIVTGQNSIEALSNECHSASALQNQYSKDATDVEVSTPGASDHYGDWPNDLGFRGAPDQLTQIELVVKGHIPDYAAGTLYRTGPDGFEVEETAKGKFAMSHWFDGFSKIHRFEIIPSSDGKGVCRVLYNSRRNVDDLVEKIRQKGNPDTLTFGQPGDPCQSYFKKVIALFSPPTLGEAAEANVGVTVSVNLPLPSKALPKSKDASKGTHGTGIKTVWAKTDAFMYKELDPETLEPLGIVDQTVLHPDLKGPLSSAHAQTDPLTGDFFNFNVEFGRFGTYRIFQVSLTTGLTNILTTITAPAAYMHSFFLTPSYIVFCVWSSHLALGGLKLLWTRNVVDSFTEASLNQPAKWYVIDRTPTRRGVIATYESDPFFAFHTVNAWEETSSSSSSSPSTDIVAELVQYDNYKILDRFQYANLLSSRHAGNKYAGANAEKARPAIVRYRLANVSQQTEPLPANEPLPRATVDFTLPKSLSGDLPNINPHTRTRPHRYVYIVSDVGPSSFLDSLVKIDTLTKSVQRWEAFGQSPSEPIFIPDPACERHAEGGELVEAGDEDRGVILSVVLDGLAGVSYLLCLDARTFREVGRAKLGLAVGFGFHGTHVGVEN